MLHTPLLTAEQIKAFHEAGFVIVRGAFDAAEMRHIERWTDELVALPEEPGRHWVYHENSRIDPEVKLISRIENISPCHSGFAELARVLAAPAAQLLGEEAVLFKEKVNFKMPGGDGFKPHQDAQAGWQAYASFFVTGMLCIDEATLENGCLELVAGHNARRLYREWQPLTDEDMAGMAFLPCPTRPGDLVLFDCYTPHASAPNLSPTTRRLYFSTYNSRTEGDQLARYYADKRKSYPPDIEREAGREYVYRV